MIRYLSIRNLAVIDSVAVEFEQAFNVLTGETGAGKSILVEAVGLLLGGRASPDLIRTGEDLAVVEAVFEADGDEIVVRREITAQGRSRAFVSGALATAATLRDLAGRLVELHGQHEHQQLLDPARHLPLLDGWAGLVERQQAVAQAFTQVRSLCDRIDRLKMDHRERAARLELVEFQLGELQRAALVAGEDASLAATRQLLRSADIIQRLCAESYRDLYEADRSVLASLGGVWKRVSELAAIDSRFAPFLQQRDGIKSELEDLAATLRDYGDSIDASPARLEEIEERLALLERLKRKHGPTLEDAIARRDLLTAEKAALTGGEIAAGEIEIALAAARQSFLDRAGDLSARRRAAAKTFASALEAELAELAMERTRFEVRLQSDESEARWSEQGIDAGEFYLSPNPGEDLRPLARIVSGGELSRVMLALKTLAADSHAGQTLIFDEVDAGIGGRAATVVGQKLHNLGNRFQVLCITHLPQIAAAGTSHFLIEKHVQAKRTSTSVTRLSNDQRIDELARMMGGAAAGPQSRAGARELLAATAATPSTPTQAKGEGARGRKRK